jgi:hypothetical protein
MTAKAVHNLLVWIKGLNFSPTTTTTTTTTQI